MSPPITNDSIVLDPDGKVFSELTTLLYISCCYTDINDIRDHYNNRECGHTSSVVREATHKIVDFFHCEVSKNYINKTILEMIMGIRKVCSNETISIEVAMYIKPYIINRLCSQYKNQSHFTYLLAETDLF